MRVCVYAPVPQFKDTSTGQVIVTPGDVWADLGTGIALQLGVSGLFYVNTAANLNGTIPKARARLFMQHGCAAWLMAHACMFAGWRFDPRGIR